MAVRLSGVCPPRLDFGQTTPVVWSCLSAPLRQTDRVSSAEPARGRTRLILVVVGALVLLVIGLWAPYMWAPQNQIAATKCAMDDQPEIGWRVLPTPGWICKPNGEYLGYWIP